MTDKIIARKCYYEKMQVTPIKMIYFLTNESDCLRALPVCHVHVRVDWESVKCPRSLQVGVCFVTSELLQRASLIEPF